MSKKYLVTGAQGFVGRYAVANILEQEPGSSILGIGRSPGNITHFSHKIRVDETPTLAPLPKSIQNSLETTVNYRYQQVDLLNQAALKRTITAFRPSHVIHLASALSGDRPDTLFRSNTEGTINLMEALGEQREETPQIVIGSTGGVYGLEATAPFNESDKTIPIQIYSVSKLAAELAAAVIANKNNTPLVYARIFNIVGPGQDERHVCGNWMAKLISLKNQPGKKELSVGTLSTTRDFIDVRDTANACIYLASHGEPGQAYNVASGRETDLKSLLSICIKTTDLQESLAITTSPANSNDATAHYAKVEKLTSLGWSAQFSLAKSIDDIYQYYTELMAQ